MKDHATRGPAIDRQGHKAFFAATEQRDHRQRTAGAAHWEARRKSVAMRMLCMECMHVGEPDTVLDGSDRIELLAWCCFALPGLLYCWWRHLQRFKACPNCGSDALMRECRAAAARRPPQATPSGGARVYSLASLGFSWPQPLGSTRVRLRNGAIGFSLLASGFVAWLLGALDVAPEEHALQAASAGWFLCATWLARQVQQIARQRHTSGCEAWGEDGRALRIERV